MSERYLGRHLGRFRIDSMIGSGGFAWVYKGYDPELDIPVAIKVLKPQYAGEETFETRFRGEASTAAKLRHPNIIRILAVGREDQAVYFVMDYLPAALDDRLRTMGTLPEPLLVRLGMDVAAALAFAHRQGVVHRDVKTDNILFDEHGNAVVADFGIARAVSGYVQQTGTNMVVGTPQYFSPEQARGLALDGRADIYSLGVTLFRAATGVLPFQGDDWYEIARQHVEEPAPRPRAYNPALSRGLERIILRCLAKSPDERYPTGEALHSDLEQLLGKPVTPGTDATVVMRTPITGPHAAVASRLSAAMGRNRRLSVILAFIGGLTAIALVAAGIRYGGAALGTPPDTARIDTVQVAPAAAPPPVQPAADSTSAVPAELPPRPKPVVQIVAPSGAVVRVDGRRLGRGTVRSDRIRPGVHKVSAAIPAIDGCPTARVEQTVRVRETGFSSVTLSPRPCGYLSMDAQPAGARWVITSADDSVVASGTTPVTEPVTLPAGAYFLRVSASYCADYRVEMTIVADKLRRERAHLICERRSD